MREPRARLRLELVQGKVLRRERESLRQVMVEVGGLLARDPVDEIDGNVVDSGITKTVHRPADVLGPATAIEHVQKVHVEALCPN